MKVHDQPVNSMNIIIMIYTVVTHFGTYGTYNTLSNCNNNIWDAVLIFDNLVTTITQDYYNMYQLYKSVDTLKQCHNHNVTF